MPNLNNKNFIGAVLLSISAGVALTLLIDAPEIIAQRKPQNRRFDIKYDLLIDRKTADLFTWMDMGNGERRLAKLDKTSESKIRKDMNQEGKLKQEKSQLEIENRELKALAQTQRRLIPKSERIFERTNIYKDFIFNSRIKYRNKEQLMLYRIAVTMDPTPSKADKSLTINEKLALSKEKCLTRIEQDSLKSLYKRESGNLIVMRFTDSDNFWLQDSSIKLGILDSKSEEEGNIIDVIKPDICSGKMNELVFHGRLEGVTFPDYQYVSDGKLVFNKVLFKKADSAKSPELDNGKAKVIELSVDEKKARELYKREYQLLDRENSLENREKLLELEERLETKERELDKFEENLINPKNVN